MVSSIKNNFRKWLIKVLMPMGQIFLEVVNRSEEKKNKISNDVILESIPIKGEAIQLNGDVVMTHPRNVVLGSNVHVGTNAWFYSLGGLIIGDNVHISRNVTIYTANHNYIGALPYDDTFHLKPVIIKKNTWIGMNVSIVPGVTIGEGAIIGLGTVISKDVPDFAIVGNPPYRILKERDKIKYQDQKKAKIFGGIDGKRFQSSGRIMKLNKENSNLLFIVGTGRSGTKTISNILDKHPDIFLKHELSEQLLRISTDYEYGKISREKTKILLQEIYCNNTVFPAVKVVGESNQKFGNLISIIFEIFPNAKFIWLKREGRKTVSSTFSKGWYQENNVNSDIFDPYIDKWEDSRLKGDLTNDFSKDQWVTLSSFQKNCWYYAYWSLKIKNELKCIPENQKLVIDLENLSSSFNKIKDFIGIKDINYNNEVYNQSKSKLYSPNMWSDEENEYFDQICDRYS